MSAEICEGLCDAADRYVTDVRLRVEQVLDRLPEAQRTVARGTIVGALDAVQAAMVAFEADVIAVATVMVD